MNTDAHQEIPRRNTGICGIIIEKQNKNTDLLGHLQKLRFWVAQQLFSFQCHTNTEDKNEQKYT